MSHWWFRSATRVVGEKVRPVSQPYGSRQLGEQDTASLFERCSVAKRHAGPRQPCRIPAGFRPGPERFPSVTQPRRPYRESQGRIPFKRRGCRCQSGCPCLLPLPTIHVNGGLKPADGTSPGECRRRDHSRGHSCERDRLPASRFRDGEVWDASGMKPWGASRYLRVAVLLDSGWDARREKMRGKCPPRRERLYRLRQAQHRFLAISWLLPPGARVRKNTLSASPALQDMEGRTGYPGERIPLEPGVCARRGGRMGRMIVGNYLEFNPHALVLRFPSSVLGERPGHVGASQSGDKRPLLERALLHIEQLRGRFLQSGLFLHPDRWSNEELRGIGCQTGYFFENNPTQSTTCTSVLGKCGLVYQPGNWICAVRGKAAAESLAGSEAREGGRIQLGQLKGPAAHRYLAEPFSTCRVTGVADVGDVGPWSHSGLAVLRRLPLLPRLLNGRGEPVVTLAQKPFPRRANEPPWQARPSRQEHSLTLIRERISHQSSTKSKTQGFRTRS